jgi:hypothetical protein
MSSSPKFRRGFKTFADNKSIELRKELGIKPSHRLPGLELAIHLKVQIQYPEDVPGIDPDCLNHLLGNGSSEWSGLGLHVREKVIVIINNSHSLGRQESTIMHELAHVICEHPMGEFKALGGGILLRDYNKVHEEEADWLGGCLLLPGRALYYAHKDGLSKQEIGEKFSASPEMVQYRMNMCGIEKRRRR